MANGGSYATPFTAHPCTATGTAGFFANNGVTNAACSAAAGTWWFMTLRWSCGCADLLGDRVPAVPTISGGPPPPSVACGHRVGAYDLARTREGSPPERSGRQERRAFRAGRRGEHAVSKRGHERGDQLHEQPCTGCGSLVRANHRFCPTCGAPLTHREPPPVHSAHS